MAWLDGNGPIRADVRTGRSSIPAGKSHPCDRPTSCGREPSAQTISVAEGRREAMRTAAKIPDQIFLRCDRALGEDAVPFTPRE